MYTLMSDKPANLSTKPATRDDDTQPDKPSSAPSTSSAVQNKEGIDKPHDKQTTTTLQEKTVSICN